MIEERRYGRVIETDQPFVVAVERVKGFLKEEGFGVLCEIDVARTLKEKLDITTAPYLILGACNPAFAHAALEREPDLGLLLPCNVIVCERDGATHIAAVRAKAMLEVTGNRELVSIADEVDARLARVLARFEAAPAKSASR
jgi:uncharacterized protein (DUF302 family)